MGIHPTQPGRDSQIEAATRAALVETYPATVRILGHHRVAKRMERLIESDFSEAHEFAAEVRAIVAIGYGIK